MNISKEQIDNLNAVLTVEIVKEDYSERVEKILKDYRKNANIPGFRKGHVPMGMVKKQYGEAVMADEVNKLIQESLNNFLTEEKLDILGNPLPKNQDDFSWKNENFKFEFEIGIAPEFEVKLQGDQPITKYKVIANEKMIEDQLASIQKQYGKLNPIEAVAEGSLVAGKFENEAEEISNDATLELANVQEKTQKLFLNAKVGDTITVNTKELFENNQLLVNLVSIAQADKDIADFDVTFTITEINERILAELNQELFDKLFTDGSVKSVEDLKEKIKEDAENQFAQQADQQLLNKVSESVIENTTFDLPADFLKKWLQTAGEKTLTEEEANEEYEKSEKGLRFQLIEGKIIKDNNLQVTFDEIKDHTKKLITAQMAQYGQMSPEDTELDGIVERVLGNQEEVKRINEQLISQKLLTYYKENTSLEEKEISFEDFIKEAYQQ